MKWPLVRLSDVTSLITKGTTPTSVGFTFEHSGVPFLRAQNLQNRKVDFSADAMFISPSTHRSLDRSIIKGGDVLLSIAGTIGRAALVETDAPSMNCNQAVAIIRSGGMLAPTYLSHWLSSDAACDQIKNRQVTATIANLSLGQIGSLSLALPPIEEQRRVAAILDQTRTSADTF